MLLTAFVIGIAGSLHCAGMCSPLALAITNFRSPAMTNRILYNLGRITMYGILGTITASVGNILPLSKYQNLFSVILGSTLITLAIVGISGTRLPGVTNVLVRFTGILKNAFSKHLGHRWPGAMLFLGALNGLLPCGLTFLALSFCITFTAPLEGFAYMFAFGIGTLPVMLGVISIADLLKNRMHLNLGKVTKGLMIVSGILLIARVFFIHHPDGHTHGLNIVDIVICR